MVRLLLNLGADPKGLRPDGSSVLHTACRSLVGSRRGVMVEVLIDAGASVHARDGLC